MTSFAEKNSTSIRRHMLAGGIACIALVCGVGGLAASTKLSGAVIAPGVLVVDSSVKRIQHPTGGVVAQINVRDGQSVRAGQVLIRLDQTVAQANYAIIAKSLDELQGRIARLEAERDGAPSVTFPPSLLGRRGEPEVTKLLAGEESLFRFRSESRAGRKAQLGERIVQLKIQVGGLKEQQAAKQQEITLVEQQLGGMRKLWKEKLTSIDRLTAVEREAVRLNGEHGQLTAAVAQAGGQIAETELQILQIDQDFRSEAGAELREGQTRAIELVERKIASEDTLKHIDIRSPQDGVVHDLSVYTLGGVIGAGEQIMQIVPMADRLMVEVNVAPQDIDQLHIGQTAELRLSAFNLQTTPELNGVLTRIAADLTADERTGTAYYRARVEIPPEELAKLDRLNLVPGMPSEVYFATGERTILSYLAKPLTDQISRAMREE